MGLPKWVLGLGVSPWAWLLGVNTYTQRRGSQQLGLAAPCTAWWAGDGEAWTPDQLRPLSPEHPGMWSGRVKLGAGGAREGSVPTRGHLTIVKRQ